MALSIGLAGLGVHGERYARHLLAGDVPGAVLGAVCRADAPAGRAFAERHRVRFESDPVALAEAVDAVVLVLPPALHGTFALAAIAAGRPLLVEKPLAADPTTAGAIVRAARGAGVPLMVGQTLRFDPLLVELRALRETVGALRSISINQRFEPSERAWLDRPDSGGLLLNTGVHGFDLLRWLTGLAPLSVRAWSARHLTRRTEDHFVAVWRLMPGDVLAVVDNARSTGSRSGRVEWVGADGQLWGDHVHRTLEQVVGRERRTLGPIPAAPTVPATLGAFVRSVTGGEEPPVTGEDGLAAVVMVEAARRSAELGRDVLLSEITEGLD